MGDENESVPWWRCGIYLPFNRVSFVTERDNTERNESEKRFQNNSTSESKLNGSEISNFYKQIISEPSVSNVKPPVNSREYLVNDRKGQSATSKKKVYDVVKNVASTVGTVGKLHHFAQDGKVSQVLNCIQNGADLNAKDSFGWTPLMCAISSGHVDVVKCLLQHGVDTKIKTSHGLTALDIAQKQCASAEILSLLNNPFQLRVIKEEEKIEHSVMRQVEFCQICQKEYEDSTESHERSIAHLFNHSKRAGERDKSFYHISEHNKGFQMMLKKGWDGNTGLGPNKEGRKFPIKTVFKTDRSCIGKCKKEKERITHFGPNDTSAVKAHSSQTLSIERERTLKKRERIKLERRKRRKEIAYRREFHMDM